MRLPIWLTGLIRQTIRFRLRFRKPKANGLRKINCGIILRLRAEREHFFALCPILLDQAGNQVTCIMTLPILLRREQVRDLNSLTRTGDRSADKLSIQAPRWRTAFCLLLAFQFLLPNGVSLPLTSGRKQLIELLFLTLQNSDEFRIIHLGSCP